MSFIFTLDNTTQKQALHTARVHMTRKYQWGLTKLTWIYEIEMVFDKATGILVLKIQVVV